MKSPDIMAFGEPEPSSTFDLLRTSFGRFFLANLVSNIALWLQDIAAAILIYQVTGSALWVSTVAVVGFGSSIVTAPIGGWLGDRFDRRRVLAVTFIAVAVAAATVAALSAVLHVVVLVLVLTAVGGAARGIYSPIGQALAADLVHRRDLAASSSLTAMGFSLGRARGPAIGAVLVTTLGGPVTFFTAAGLALLFIVLILSTPVTGTARIRRAPSEGRGSVLAFIAARPRLLVLLIVSAIMGMMTDPVITLGPALSDKLNAPGWMPGVFVSAFGTGAVLTGLSGAWLRRRVGSPRLATAGLVVLGACLILVAHASTPIVVIAALVLAGSAFLAANIDVITELQEQIDDDVRGRVWAVWSVGFLGSRPVAALIEGGIADQAGVPTALTVMAGVALLGAGLAFLSGERWLRRQ